MIVVRVPITLRSTLNSREHWSVRHKRTKTEREATAFLLRFEAPQRPALPVVVTLARHFRHPGKPMDDDNLAGAFKAVRDQVAEWLGVDDADPRVSWHYSQQKGDSDFIQIRMEEA